jgi:hypothetical protein
VFEFIEQKAKSDCVIAATAMFTGLSYDKIMETAAELYVPDHGTSDVSRILRDLGFRQENYHGKHNGDGRAFKTIYLPWELQPKLLKEWMWGREAMFSVPSLNIEGGWHMIYYDGLNVYDPNPTTKKRYTNFDDVDPRDAYIWEPKR